MSRPARPTLAHRLQYGLFLGVEGLVRCLPLAAAQSLGRAMGRLYYRIDGRHRRVVRDNLRASNLGLDEAAVRDLSRACFEHFGALAFGVLRLLRATPETLRRVTRIEGLEHLRAAMAEGKGAIGLTGHFGNWELMALALSLEQGHLAVVGRELDNPLLEARLRAFRSRFGNEVISKDGAVRGTLKALKEGKVIGFLLDQDALTAGVFVTFLGRWAATFSTAALMAVRFDLPILPLASRVEPDGTVSVTVHPPWHALRTGDTARDIWITTQAMTAWIEARVRENPGQWFWMHRRFKTQPGPGRPEVPPAEWREEAGAGRCDGGVRP